MGDESGRDGMDFECVLDAANDPLEYAGVLCEPGPEETAAGVLPELVDLEHAWGTVGEHLAHVQPMRPLVSHVVAREGQHRERVLAQFSDGALHGCGLLGGDRRSDIAAVVPVARLENQQNVAPAATTEQDRVDNDAVLAALLVRLVE